MYAAAWSAPPSMSFTQPRGSSGPAPLDITYSRSAGAPELALLGSEPHLQPDTEALAERASAPRTVRQSATEVWRATGACIARPRPFSRANRRLLKPRHFRPPRACFRLHNASVVPEDSKAKAP